MGAHAAAGRAERSVAEAAKRADSFAWCLSRVEVSVRVSGHVLALASVFWTDMTHCRNYRCTWCNVWHEVGIPLLQRGRGHGIELELVVGFKCTERSYQSYALQRFARAPRQSHITVKSITREHVEYYAQKSCKRLKNCYSSVSKERAVPCSQV